MKIALILTSFLVSLSTLNAPKSLLNEPKSASKYDEITKFEDFIPSNEDLKTYYGDVKYLFGENLILNLENTISKDNTKRHYSGGYTAKNKYWQTYYLLDRDYKLSPLNEIELKNLKMAASDDVWWNTSYVYCNVLYEPESIIVDSSHLNKKNDPEAIHIDREHVYPKSFGFNIGGSSEFENYMAGCDLHNLHMGESESNQDAHNNYLFGNIDSAKVEFKSSNSNKVGSYHGYKNTNGKDYEVFEPIDKDKGDIARSLLYMVTRYHTYKDGATNIETSPRLVLSDSPSDFGRSSKDPKSTKDGNVKYGFLSDIVSWNEIDAVNDNEKIRNSLNHTFVQHNRNPYIDFPKWVDVAFNPDSIYYADINAPEGVNERFDFKDENLIKDRYGTAEKIDLTKFSFQFVDETGLKEVNKNDIKITLLNKNTSEEKDITNKKEISFTDEGNYVLKVELKNYPHPIIKNFSVGNLIDSTIENYNHPFYDGDTFVLDKIHLRYDVNGVKTEVPRELCKYYLIDKDGNETEITKNFIVKEGEYKLRVKAQSDDGKKWDSSTTIVVKPFDSVVSYSFNLENVYKTENPISLKNAKMQYKRNGKYYTVDSYNISFKLINNLTKKEVEITDGYILKESGKFTVQGTYEVDENHTLVGETEIEVEQAQFWEIPKYQKLIFIGLCIILVLMLIGAIVIIIKKKKKHK